MAASSELQRRQQKMAHDLRVLQGSGRQLTHLMYDYGMYNFEAELKRAIYTLDDIIRKSYVRDRNYLQAVRLAKTEESQK